MTAAPAPDLISARDAAALMGVNRATVINWARDGRIAAVQYGPNGIYRFDRNEIHRFIAASRLPGGREQKEGQS